MPPPLQLGWMRGVKAARMEASRRALSSLSRPSGFSSSRSARTSSRDELGKVPWRDPNRVRDTDVRQLTRGAELVNRGGADAEALGYLVHRQQLLGQLHVPRGHRGDKSSLVERGTDSIRCIESLGAPNDVERLDPGATQCQSIRARRIGLGCKWSLVQIQSPRPLKRPNRLRLFQRVRALFLGLRFFAPTLHPLERILPRVGAAERFCSPLRGGLPRSRARRYQP
jgi:hypothetical protein